MKKLLIVFFLVMSTSAFAGSTRYSADASASAIAVDQQVKMETAGNSGLNNCLFINTRTGRCFQETNLWAGGGDSGSAGASAGASAGSAGAGSSGGSSGGSAGSCK